MTCPVTGKPCLKYKAYTMTEKKGSESHSYAVCEDCMNLNDSLSFEDELGPCPECGEVLESIVKSSRIGCAKCYDHFEEPLSYMIATAQGTPNSLDKHVGPAPESYKKSLAESTTAVGFAKELEQKKEAAQKEERYEEASRISLALSKIMEFISRSNEKGELDPEDRAELSKIVYSYMFPESVDGL